MKKMLLSLALAALPATAFAHVGAGDTHGVALGFFNPLTGVDHILAMVAVGMFAAHLGGRAIWLIPSSFVSMMVFGGTLGVAGVSVLFVEIGIESIVPRWASAGIDLAS